MNEKQSKRFWSRIQVGKEDECWPWTGNCDGHGYGQMWFDNKHHKVHRMIWEMENGPIGKDVSLMHSCNMRNCCNVKHLYIPTTEEKTTERFWSFVNIGEPDECWEWQGCFTKTGYGTFYAHGKQQRAHRYAYEITNGPLPKWNNPSNGTCVCHKCDNPKCVNPDHLFLGSHADNQTDKTNKGRTPHGMQHWNSKLSSDDVKAIKTSVDMTARQLAGMYGVGIDQIRCIKNGRSRRDG